MLASWKKIRVHVEQMSKSSSSTRKVENVNRLVMVDVRATVIGSVRLKSASTIVGNVLPNLNLHKLLLQQVSIKFNFPDFLTLFDSSVEGLSK